MILGSFAVLFVIAGTARARPDNRKLGNWAPAVNGECNFIEDYIQWVIHPGGYNPDCNCGYFNPFYSTPEDPAYIEPPCPPVEAGYADCLPRVCAWQDNDNDLDVVTAYALAHVNASVTFVDLAQYVLGQEEDTTMCFPAKGYQISQDIVDEPGFPDQTEKVTVHGHVLVGIDEVEPLPEEIKNIRIPGSYWMEGGTLAHELRML